MKDGQCPRAMTEAGLTHHDPLAGEVAVAVNKLCRSLIHGAGWDDAVDEFAAFIDQTGPGTNGGFAPDVLRAALHFVGTSPSFAEALERSLEFAGSANYCPVLVGALGGARWGASAIPRGAMAHVDIRAGVEEAASGLAGGWAGGGHE